MNRKGVIDLGAAWVSPFGRRLRQELLLVAAVFLLLAAVALAADSAEKPLRILSSLLSIVHD